MRGKMLQIFCVFLMIASALADQERSCPDGTVLVHEPYANGCQLKDSGSGGVRHGHWEIRDASGTLRQVGEFAYGRQNGVWSYWYEDGRKQEERPYWNGKLHGLRRRWDARGRSDGMECFIDGARRRLDECSHVKFAYEPVRPEPTRRSPASALQH